MQLLPTSFQVRGIRRNGNDSGGLLERMYQKLGLDSQRTSAVASALETLRRFFGAAQCWNGMTKRFCDVYKCLYMLSWGVGASFSSIKHVFCPGVFQAGMWGCWDSFPELTFFLSMCHAVYKWVRLLNPWSSGWNRNTSKRRHVLSVVCNYTVS